MTPLSRFSVDVVPIRLLPHPNADSLSIVEVYGYTVVVRTEDWKHVDRAAFIPPDSVVPVDRPEYAFLDGKSRITVRRFRGVMSHGLLMPAPQGARVGDSVAELMGITHYEPPVSTGVITSGEAEAPPLGGRPVYDIEHMRRFPNVLQQGEQVIVTEKIHGSNARFTFQDGRFWAGSRNEFKRFYGDGRKECVWWQILDGNDGLCRMLYDNPGITVYGEIYGDVQELKYGHGKGEISFRAFDILKGPERPGRLRSLADSAMRRFGYVRPVVTQDTWMNFIPARSLALEYGVRWAPGIYEGPFYPALLSLADGDSTIPGAEHIREGVVIKPMVERYDPVLGRVQLKVVSDDYLENVSKSKGKGKTKSTSLDTTITVDVTQFTQALADVRQAVIDTNAVIGYTKSGQPIDGAAVRRAMGVIEE